MTPRQRTEKIQQLKDLLGEALVEFHRLYPRLSLDELPQDLMKRIREEIHPYQTIG